MKKLLLLAGMIFLSHIVLYAGWTYKGTSAGKKFVYLCTYYDIDGNFVKTNKYSFDGDSTYTWIPLYNPEREAEYTHVPNLYIYTYAIAKPFKDVVLHDSLKELKAYIKSGGNIRGSELFFAAQHGSKNVTAYIVNSIWLEEDLYIAKDLAAANRHLETADIITKAYDKVRNKGRSEAGISGNMVPAEWKK